MLECSDMRFILEWYNLTIHPIDHNILKIVLIQKSIDRNVVIINWNTVRSD